MVNTPLGTRIRDARKMAGLSQERLAVAAGIASATIARLESGIDPNPRLETLRAVADVLDLDIGELVA